MKKVIIENYKEKASIIRTLLYLFILAFFSFFVFSCQKEVKSKCKDCMILHASLDEETISLERFFDKIELIPLETTDNSLIRSIEKYVFFDGKHYILDRTQSILFIFDKEGFFLNRIDKKGQGPGEYSLIYDFSVNPKKEQIEMLSPYRYIYCYDFDGNFIKKYDLTFLEAQNIQNMNILDDKNYIVWSCNPDNQDGISIISQETGEQVNSFWQDHSIFNVWTSNVFYTFEDETYFCLRLYNTVYKVTKGGMEAIYEWNFGNKTMDISRYDLAHGLINHNRDRDNMIKLLEDKIIPYEISRHAQNKRYYYIELLIGRKNAKHVFYDKVTGKSTYIDEYFSEGVRFRRMLFFTDEFIINMLDYNSKEKLLECPLLDEANKKKLLSFKWDDNPFLIKYYFKKDE